MMEKLFVIVLVIFTVVNFIDYGAAEKIECVECTGSSAKECEKNQNTTKCDECASFNGWVKEGPEPSFFRGCKAAFSDCETLEGKLAGKKDQDVHCDVCKEANCNKKEFGKIPETNPSPPKEKKEEKKKDKKEVKKEDKSEEEKEMDGEDQYATSTETDE